MPKLNLYFLTNDRSDWGCTRELVIAAFSEAEAREIAANETVGDENPGVDPTD